MRVGDLVRMKVAGSVWITLDIVYETAFVYNIHTSHSMWANEEAFEVISASR